MERPSAYIGGSKFAKSCRSWAGELLGDDVLEDSTDAAGVDVDENDAIFDSGPGEWYPLSVGDVLSGIVSSQCSILSFFVWCRRQFGETGDIAVTARIKRFSRSIDGDEYVDWSQSNVDERWV